MNQVVMSEDERDRIIQEHEKNLAELESRYCASKVYHTIHIVVKQGHSTVCSATLSVAYPVK